MAESGNRSTSTQSSIQRRGSSASWLPAQRSDIFGSSQSNSNTRLSFAREIFTLVETCALSGFAGFVENGLSDTDADEPMPSDSFRSFNFAWFSKYLLEQV